MKKLFCWVVFNCFLYVNSSAQELFALTEPASNMSTHSIGVRLNSNIMREKGLNDFNTHVNPEVMVGLSRNFMMHGDVFLSNVNNTFKTEGASLYAKYRVYSQDEVHSHFRVATFARLAVNNAEIHQMAIDHNGHNTGFELGTIATKLIHKVALSSSVSFIRALNNFDQHDWAFGDNNRDAINYTLSVGKLMLPKEYVNYNQTNLNLMFECLAQTNFNTGKTFVDIAPIVQLIFLSKMRFDVGYRTPIVNDLERTAPSGLLFRFEYNFFSAF